MNIDKTAVLGLGAQESFLECFKGLALHHTAGTNPHIAVASKSYRGELGYLTHNMLSRVMMVYWDKPTVESFIHVHVTKPRISGFSPFAVGRIIANTQATTLVAAGQEFYRIIEAHPLAAQVGASQYVVKLFGGGDVMIFLPTHPELLDLLGPSGVIVIGPGEPNRWEEIKAERPVEEPA